MKTKARLSCSDDEDYQSLTYCWWRSAAGLEDCVRMKKLELPNIANLTPRVRLLRELERLAIIAQDGSLNELRYKLQMYGAGDLWVPTGGILKEEMDIPSSVTILLVGFSGSGKSSLINLMYSVLGRSGLVPFAQTSTGKAANFTTMYMEEHNVMRTSQNGFCVYDSRGFDYDKMDETLAELSSWIDSGVYHNQLCLRSGENEETVTAGLIKPSSKFVQRTVNFAMVVINIADLCKALKCGDSKSFEATGELFSHPALQKCSKYSLGPDLSFCKHNLMTTMSLAADENPILILTHGDLLTSEDRIQTRLKLCEYLGISETNGVYDIVCVTEYGFLAEESDPVTAYGIAEAVHRALLISDRGHLPKNNFQDWAVLVLSWLMCLMGAVFAFLADICTRLGQKNKLRN